MTPPSVQPQAYLVAPLFAPTLHVLFTPAWLVLDGRANEASVAMAWQTIAWFALQAVCLATQVPVLWLLRRVALPRVPAPVAWTAATLLAALASYALLRASFISWCCALAASVLVFARFRTSPAPDVG